MFHLLTSFFIHHFLNVFGFFFSLNERLLYTFCLVTVKFVYATSNCPKVFKIEKLDLDFDLMFQFSMDRINLLKKNK